MENIVAYQAKCKKCGKIFATNKTPSIPNMPAKCDACDGDMSVEPKFEMDGRGRTYEMQIFCKETGANHVCSANLTEQDMLEPNQKELRKKFTTVIVEAFATAISNEKNVTKLLSRT